MSDLKICLQLYQQAFKLFQKDSSPIGQSIGVLYSLNITLYNLTTTNSFARILRDELLIRFPSIERSTAKSSFYVPV